MAAAVLSLGLAACAGPVVDETPGLAGRGIPTAINTQTYTPSGVGTAPDRRAEELARAAEARSSAPPQTEPQSPPQQRPAESPRRRGSSSPPPSTLHTGPPVVPLPNPTTDRAVADFKRDQVRRELDHLQARSPLGPTDPFEQRELMKRQLELDRMNMDAIRR